MAEPTSAYTVQDLITRVAKSAGIAYFGSTGSGIACVPIDEHDLDRCLGVVNDGIKAFIAASPQNGWRWMQRVMNVTTAPALTGIAESGTATTLVDSDIADVYDDDYFSGYVLKVTAGTGEDETATITDYDGASGEYSFSGLSGGSTPDDTTEYRICLSTSVVDSDASRYLLPDDFQGEVGGEITYEAGSNIGCDVQWTSPANIQKLRETGWKGTPKYAAVRPYTGRRWELILFPEPNAELTLEFSYVAGFANMQAVSGTSTAGDSTSLTDGSKAGLYPDDYFIGWTIGIISGTGRNSYAVVTGYTGLTGVYAVEDWLAKGGVAGGTDPAASSDYFVTDGERHPAGMQFDEAVLASCLGKAELEFEDLSVGYLQKFLQVDLPNAHRIDARSAPKNLGPMLSGNRNRGILQQHTTRNNVTIV